MSETGEIVGAYHSLVIKQGVLTFLLEMCLQPLSCASIKNNVRDGLDGYTTRLNLQICLPNSF